MDLSGVFSLVAFVVGLILLVPLIVAGVFVVIVVANRSDADLTGRRPAAVYAFSTAFLTLFVTLFATTASVASLCRLIGSDDAGAASITDGGFLPLGGSGSGHQHPLGDSVAQGAVLGAIVALVAGVMFVLHLRAARAATDDAVIPEPLARLRSTYVAAVAFVAVSVAIGASVVVLYDIFRGIAPGVFSASGHADSVDVLRSMIPALYLAVAALAILAVHLRHAPPPFQPGVFSRLFGGPAAPAAAPAPPSAPPPTTAPPTSAPPEVLESKPRRAPRKRAPRKTTPRKTVGD